MTILSAVSVTANSETVKEALIHLAFPRNPWTGCQIENVGARFVSKRKITQGECRKKRQREHPGVLFHLRDDLWQEAINQLLITNTAENPRASPTHS